MTNKELQKKFIEVVTDQDDGSSEQFPEEVSFLKDREFIQIPVMVEAICIEGFFDDLSEEIENKWNEFSWKIGKFINECPVLNIFNKDIKQVALAPEIKEFLVNGDTHILRYNDSCTRSLYFVERKDMENLKKFIRMM
jgi:hypothetical protein